MDDYTAISPRITPGWRFNEIKSRMEWTKIAYEEDKNKPPDCLTAQIMANIMSSIDPDIQLTWDAPGNNINKKMPVLDLQNQIYILPKTNGIKCSNKQKISTILADQKECFSGRSIKKTTQYGLSIMSGRRPRGS